MSTERTIEESDLNSLLVSKVIVDPIAHFHLDSEILFSNQRTGLELFCENRSWFKAIVYFPKKLYHEVWQDPSQPAITCLKLIIETLEQGVKYGQS